MKLNELTPELAQRLHTQLVQDLLRTQTSPSPYQWQILCALRGFAHREIWHDLAQQHYHRGEQEAFLRCANFANDDNWNSERHQTVLKDWLENI